jgi:hypothetical protein
VFVLLIARMKAAGLFRARFQTRGHEVVCNRRSARALAA